MKNLELTAHRQLVKNKQVALCIFYRIKWSFKNKDGVNISLTKSYEPEKEARPLFDKFKYSIEFHNKHDTGGIDFVLIIRG